MISEQHMMAALAGPANRQGRIVANHICGINESYQGTLATSVAKIFDKAVGLNRAFLKKRKMLKATQFTIMIQVYIPSNITCQLLPWW